MPGILIYSEDGAVARQLVTAGLALKEEMREPITVVAATVEDRDMLVTSGADKVVILSGGSGLPEGNAGAIAKLAAAEKASVLLFGGTPRGKDAAARVAAELKAGLVTDALSIRYADGAIETSRLVYGGLAVAVEQTVLPALATIPPRTFDAAAASGHQAEVVVTEVESDERVTVDSVCPIVRQGADITAASRIVCVGRGLSKQEDLALAEALAGALGAEIACTRGIAEDYHWLPVERYIGISGQKVKPELYISLGVSGQVQHVAGIRDAKVIVAVDSNEKAPIFEAADYGIVGDLYEVAPLIAEALKKA